MSRPRTFPLSAALVALFALTAASARAQTSGANTTHDPSRIVESDGKFYFCSTGGRCASSTDGLAWSTTGLRITVPSWSTTYAPGGNQGVWAPDIVLYNGVYYIYYSFCGVPAANAPCVIGLYTTPTLDSTSSRYKLTDVGMVVNNPMNDATYQFSTIDPGPILDPSGNLWISWGSGYGKDQTQTQLWLTRLDTTGLPLASDSAYQPPTVLGHALEPGRREGSYVHARNGTYYLFWNEGSCCDGTTSTYTIWVARSPGSITGPYSGAKVFYAGGGDIHGPGHMGIYSACGVERFTYHYYPTATSVLGENDLTWSSDDWPVAGATSTTALTPCGAGGTSGGGGAAGAGVAGGGGGGAPGRGGSAGGGAPGRGGAGGAAGTGAGGAAGSGGQATGGATGSGGSTSSGGSTGTGGTIGTGGAPGTGGGGLSPGSGGVSGGLGGSSGEATSGCSCSVPAGAPAGGACVLLLAAGSMLASRRRGNRRAGDGRSRQRETKSGRRPKPRGGARTRAVDPCHHAEFSGRAVSRGGDPDRCLRKSRSDSQREWLRAGVDGNGERCDNPAVPARVVFYGQGGEIDVSAEMGTLVMWLALGAIALIGDLVYGVIAKSKKRR